MNMDITPNKENRAYMTATEVMMVLSISATTLWRHVKSGELPKPFYVGKRRYWRHADIINSIEAV
mgnify:CR=1 FL=1